MLIAQPGATLRAIRYRPPVQCDPSAGSTFCPRERRQRAKRIESQAASFRYGAFGQVQAASAANVSFTSACLVIQLLEHQHASARSADSDSQLHRVNRSAADESEEQPSGYVS